MPLLEAKALIALSDDEAIEILNLTRQSANEPAARTFLRQRIQALEEARRRIVATRQGGWSAADDERLAGLIAIYDDLRERPYAPYLVRALVADRAIDASFDVRSCVGEVLEIASFAPQTRARTNVPERAALVIFLEKPPTKAVPRWTQGGPATEDR